MSDDKPPAPGTPPPAAAPAAPEAERYWLDYRDRSGRTHNQRWPSRHEREREEVIKCWFGEALGTAEILYRQRPETPIAAAVDTVLKKLGKLTDSVLLDLQEKWAQIVGGDIAKVTTPVALNQKKLDVEVTQAAWLYELERAHKKRLVEKLTAATQGKVTDIRFVATGRRAPAPRLPLPPTRPATR